MDQKTIWQLNEINQQFYVYTADDFSQSRSYPWSGWKRLLPVISKHPSNILQVLDVGCGNGRLGEFLFKNSKKHLTYTGVDSSEKLLKEARDKLKQRANVLLHRMDILQADLYEAPLLQKEYDLVGCFGVLHHIPGLKNRINFLKLLSSMLKADGILAVSMWQFGRKKRFANKTVSFEEYNMTHSPFLDISQVEKGDYLLTWRDSRWLRYCHFIDKQERKKLLDNLPLKVIDEFRADGRSGDLNYYLVMKRESRD